MRYEDEADLEYIDAPMDIDNFRGVTEGRLGPWLKWLFLGFGPIIFVPYLLQFTPLLLILITLIIWNIIILALTVGEHKKKVKKYRAQLYDEYSSTYELLNLKKANNNGLVEYLDNTVSYFIACELGSKEDDETKSIQFEKFYNNFSSKYRTNYYFVNVEASAQLASRYRLAKAFRDKNARNDYIAIIDHNTLIASRKSRLFELVIEVKGRRDQHKEIADNIDRALRSASTRIFKRVFLLEDEDDIEKVLSRDLDTYVSYQDWIRMKYTTEKYFGSHVIGYDLPEDEDVEETINYEEDEKIDRGFLIR